MNAQELQRLLQSSPPPQLIQVLPEEIYAAAHIPGARNACVYEMTFVDQVRALISDPSACLIVYGAGDGSIDAATAVEKLRAGGYAHVQDFAGGLAEWKAAGLPLEGSGNLPHAAVPDGEFRVDTEQSVVRWTGRNLFNHHSGTVKLASGEIRLARGELVSAGFVIEMGSIACEDLTDPAYNGMLIAHLRSADFFDVERHPTARFVAKTVEKIHSCTDGTPNYRLKGEFTLRGVTRPLEFPAVIAAAEDGRRVTGQAQFELDRTEYGSQYGSGKFFRFLGKHVVNDCIHLHIKIHADSVA